MLKFPLENLQDKLFEQLKVTLKDQIFRLLYVLLIKLTGLVGSEAKKILGEGRKDKSGDYTKGANLNNESD